MGHLGCSLAICEFVLVMSAWIEVISLLSVPVVGSSMLPMALVAASMKSAARGRSQECGQRVVLVAGGRVESALIERQLAGGVVKGQTQRGHRRNVAGAAGVVGEALQSIGELVNDALARQRAAALPDVIAEFGDGRIVRGHESLERIADAGRVRLPR